jgi:glycosyltransferase involved in cell wall biosynthesis
MTIPASVFIICRDEERVIEDCLLSVARFKEIVIVDSGSTDRTLEIVRKLAYQDLPIRILEHPWTGYSRQKQYAMNACTEPWCLNLDADERLDPALIDAIAERISLSTSVCAYSMKRVNYLPGYGFPPRSVHAKYIVRLVNKNECRYDTSIMVHESFLLSGSIEKIEEGIILHDRNISIEEEIDKNRLYSNLKSEEEYKKGRRASFFSILLRPIGQLLKIYIGQRFLICGIPGLIYAGMLAVYVFQTEAMLYRKETMDLE